MEQLSLTSVRVSWHGLLQRQDCADNILVKHFRGSTTSDYKISELLSVGTNSLILAGLNPNQPYTYQVRQLIQLSGPTHTQLCLQCIFRQFSQDNIAHLFNFVFFRA